MCHKAVLGKILLVIRMVRIQDILAANVGSTIFTGYSVLLHSILQHSFLPGRMVPAPCQADPPPERPTTRTEMFSRWRSSSIVDP